MITMNLVGAIQEYLNKNYDQLYAVEITSVSQQLSSGPNPTVQGDLLIQFTCHGRKIGQKSYRRLSVASWDGSTLEVPNTIILGSF